MRRDPTMSENTKAPVGASARGRPLRIASMAVLLAAGILTATGAVAAVQPPRLAAAVASAVQAGALTVDVDKAELLTMPGPGATVFIANPDIADVQTPDPRRVLIFGKKPGATTAYVFAPGGGVTSYAVTVRRPVGDVAAALRAEVPGATVDVSRAPGGMTVTGRVASPIQAEALKAAAQQYLAEKEPLTFNVVVDGSTQVNLQVRVAEVSRQVSKSLGFNWNAVFNDGTVAVGVLTGREPSTAFGQFIRDTSTSQLSSIGVGYKNGSVNMSALVDALQSNGLITVLAEPNLTAISGATANFLAGGEIPVPVSQGLQQITIEWKRFGISVDFTPTVLDSNRISMRVRPEVSQLSDVGAVTLNNIKVPSIAVRRAETTVELGSGESFAIAGLFQNNMSNSVKDYPGLGDLPILGPLLRSTSFQRSESELVIIVTPYIVRPVARPSDLRMPTEAINYSNDLERILLGRTTAAEAKAPLASAGSAPPHLAGPAGFMLEDKP